MMESRLFTPVALPTQVPTLDCESQILCLGSCFAQEVGERLVHQFGEGQVVVNPLGPLYSTDVIHHTLSRWLQHTPLEVPFHGHDGVWHSWDAASLCSGATEEECALKTSEAWHNGQAALHSCSHLVLTFGTTRSYALTSTNREDSRLVANCHKEPSTLFTEVEPSLNEMISRWQELIGQIRSVNPQIEIILTVSPYRYRKYGFHESQVQKAKLLLLCDALKYSTHYFPSYEILLDELRDYRFYAPDMLHPTPQAVDIITERFRQWCFSQELMRQSEEKIKEWRRSQHHSII